MQEEYDAYYRDYLDALREMLEPVNVTLSEIQHEYWKVLPSEKYEFDQ